MLTGEDAFMSWQGHESRRKLSIEVGNRYW